MLAWKNTQWAAPEKILAIIFEAGFITPADLQWVSGLSDRTIRRAIQKLAAHHAEPPVQRYRWNSSRVAYYLSGTGVKMAHSIHGITAKPIAAQGYQVSHALGLNGILFRYVRAHPDKQLRWYTTRDATETLLYLRGQVTGEEEGLMKKTLVHPDAIWQLSHSF